MQTYLFLILKHIRIIPKKKTYALDI
jgi:hypothetical protein